MPVKETKAKSLWDGKIVRQPLIDSLPHLCFAHFFDFYNLGFFPGGLSHRPSNKQQRSAALFRLAQLTLDAREAPGQKP